MTARDRQRRRRRHSSDPARLVLIGLGMLFGSVVVALGIVVGYVVSVANSVPALSTLKPVDNGANSTVYAADGSPLGVIVSDKLRSPIPSSQIPAILKQATVAIEDQRFYQHHGVDLQAIIRAAATDVSAGKPLQGGSTLTMQLVHNLYISADQRSLKFKIREAVLAEQLEKAHPKDWILTDYLNTVPYGTVGGQNALGVQAAARIFFNKTAGQLDLPEAATLAGLPQAPSDYNPFNDPAAALKRRNEVLDKMAQLNYITGVQAIDAENAPLGVQHGTFYTTHREQFFFDYVKQELINRYGANTVLQGGLKIYTTIDPKLQTAARAAIQNVLGQPGDPASAIVSIDPRTGYIKAMAQSEQYNQSQFNLATQGHRQPGSTFKTVVLMTGLRRGVDPNSTYYTSMPLDFTDPIWGPIKVQTYSNTYAGTENIVQATLQSDNTIYQQFDLDLGPRNVRQTAIDMGVVSPLEGLPAEGLGGLKVGVSPLEMADAYATIASGGYRNKPISVTKVVFPDGHVDDLSAPQRVQAFSDGVTAAATAILHQNILSGTGTAANYGCPAAGKTGTTDNFTDAWFDGFTPHMSTVVWVGYPKGKIPMTNVHGIAVAGGTFPAQIWHAYMQVAMKGDCTDFSKPTTALVFKPFTGRYLASSGGGGGGGGSTGFQSQPTQTQTTTTPAQPNPGGSPAPGTANPPVTNTPKLIIPPGQTVTPPSGTGGGAVGGGVVAPVH
ncbi:MAG TPA: transglycosylase domain-containing protein [Solirubrobacteraceae bacterium]|nr:transglycosylase domain-containing protein [Solirubrobacteraceae bacterium]